MPLPFCFKSRFGGRKKARPSTKHPFRSALRLELLENRLLPSLTPTLLGHLNPDNFGSNPRLITEVNGLVFFSANDGIHGNELWESNGTAAGTFLVKDINGTKNSGPYYPTNVNGTLFFGAFDGTHGAELWESNGTAAGTFLVKDINPGASSFYPYALTNM